MIECTKKSDKRVKTKSVIIALGDYHPTPSANGICVEKIANEFVDRGYCVHLVANDLNVSKNNKKFGNIQVDYIKQTFLWRLNDIERKTDLKILKTVLIFIKKIFIILRFPLVLFTYPLDSSMRYRTYCNKIRKLIHENNVSFVIGVNKPVDAIWGAYLASIKENIPMVSYFLDPLVGGYENKRISKFVKKNRALVLEELILKHSSKIIFMDEHKNSVRKRYGDDFKDKIKYLGVPLMVNNVGLDNNKSDTQNEKIVLYAGTIYKNLRNPQYIMKVFNYVKKAKLVMYITNSCDWINKYVNNNVMLKEKVPHDVLVNEIQNSYALLNIGNSDPIFAPSKVIEYMGFCKPIISTFCIDGDSSKKYLNRYPSALLLDEREGNIKEVASKIDFFLDNQSNSPSFDELKIQYYDNTPEAFVDFVDVII